MKNIELRYKLKDVWLERAEAIKHKQSKRIYLKTQKNFRFDTNVWNIFTNILNTNNKRGNKKTATKEIETLILNYIQTSIVELNIDEQKYLYEPIENTVKNIKNELYKYRKSKDVTHDFASNKILNIDVFELNFISKLLEIQANKNRAFNNIYLNIKNELDNINSLETYKMNKDYISLDKIENLYNSLIIITENLEKAIFTYISINEKFRSLILE